MKKSILVVTALLICFSIYADRGSIPFNPFIRIFEPEQNAIIAWNGKTQCLLLSTQLSSSEPTKILEVIPFMTEPTVKKGEHESFTKAMTIINRERYKNLFSQLNQDLSRTRSGRQAPAEVTHREQIGAHDISIIRLISPEGFFEWVENYLKENGASRVKVGETMKRNITKYMADGYKYFVFDVVELDGTVKTIDPILYTFESDHLYYPIKISTTDTGKTEISLIVITKNPLTKFYDLHIDDVKLMHDIIDISYWDVKHISDDISKLFKEDDTLKLRLWNISGTLSEMDKDLIAK